MSKLGKKELDTLSKDIKDWVDQSKSAKNALKDRWTQVDQMYYEGIPGTMEKPWPTAPTYPYPVAKTRMDQVTAFVAGSITRSDPYIMVRGSGEIGKFSNGVQSCLHYFLKKAEYARVIREAINVAQRRGCAVVRPSYIEGYEPKDGLPVKSYIKIDVIDPNDVAVYPNWATEWDDMQMIGHRYEVQKSYVEAKQKSGEFFKGKVDESQEEDRYLRPSKQATEDFTNDGKSGAVTLYDLCVKTDEGIKRVIWCEGSCSVLKYSDYGMSEPSLTRLCLHYEDNRFFNETSRGFDLVPVQQYEQDLRNLILSGGLMNAFPVLFGQQTQLLETAQQVKPGAFIKYSGNGQIFSPNAKSDTNALAGLLQYSGQDADMVSKVSQMGMGASLRGSQTATEANAVYQGQMTGVSEDTANLSIGLARLAKQIVELLYWQFEDWYPQYAPSMPLVEQEHFGFEFSYEVNGETATNSPQAIASQVVELLGVVPQVINAEMTLANMSMQFVTDPMGQPTGIQPYVPFILKNPDFIPELIRSLVDSSQLPAKETVLKPRQELENGENGMEGVLPVEGLAGLAGMVGDPMQGFAGSNVRPAVPFDPGGLPEPSDSAPDADEPI